MIHFIGLFQENIENGQQKRHIHLLLDNEYAPFYKKNRGQKMDIIQQDMLRAAGKRHIDLWTEGSIYPKDPLSQKHPEFSGLTSLVKFVGEGNAGLLGYTKRLQTQSQVILSSAEMMLMMKNQEISELKNMNQNKENECKELKVECKKLRDIGQAQKNQKKGLVSKLKEAKVEHKKLSSTLQKTMLYGTTVSLQPRQRMSSRKPLSELSRNGGQFRRRVYAEDVHMKQMGDSGGGSIIANMLPSEIVELALSQPKHKRLATKIVRECLEDVKKEFSSEDAQIMCDKFGISNEAYSNLYKRLDASFVTVLKRKNLLPLPRPYHVRETKKVMNESVMETIGEPEHLCHIQTFKFSSKEVSFKLHKHNNFILDVIKLQIAMVKFYNMSVLECGGKLKFVLKLDESEIVKGQKMERVSLTLMNRALDSSISSNSPNYFSVQSENEIWWLAAFEVPLEHHDILKTFFSLTQIPNVVHNQSIGNLLHVEGFGDYSVEWHLAGDLKTLKCMFGISNAANARFPCLYGMCSRKKTKNGKEWNIETSKRGAPTRDNFISHLGKLVREDPNWDPILDISLKRVHFCTMHALIRIVEKLVYEHICFAYKMQPASESQAACKKLEDVLSSVGLHRGQVEIRRDEKRSGASGNLPCKPCFGGPKARKFLSAPKDEEGKILVRHPEKYEAWKKLLMAVPDRSNGGRTQIAKGNAWRSLDEVAVLLQKMRFTQDDSNKFHNAVQIFHRSMVDAWGEFSITHYMVSFRTLD